MIILAQVSLSFLLLAKPLTCSGAPASGSSLTVGIADVEATSSAEISSSSEEEKVPPLYSSFVKNSQSNMKFLAELFSKNITTVFNNATQRPYYQQKYQCTLIPVSEREGDCLNPVDMEREDRPPLVATLIRINGTQLASGFAAELEEKMRQKMDAVKRSVKAAEQAYVDYKEDNSLKGITYFNAKRINRPWMVDKYFAEDNSYRSFYLHYDTHFKADVNLSHSVVHVPTNVFDGSVEINNGAKWTMRLNDIFVDNREIDQSIYWQYFGSALGFYRVFPGSKWATSPDKVEMFDCRTKGWYIQASCSPKDVVILLDSSGSMLGLRFRIAMNTVDQILKTLGEDDFFNIIKVDKTVEYVDQCFNRSLLQATADNRERLRSKIRAIKPHEMADLGQGLVEAFNLFNKTASEKWGSLCNRIIMIITDGATDTYEKVFQMYNINITDENGLSPIRVFGFLIGEDSGYNRELNQMCCRNKGYYVEIKTIAAVQDNMKQYVTTLARPLALADFNDVTWTNVYIDEAEYEYSGTAKKKRKPRQSLPKKKKYIKSSNPDMRLMASVAAPVFDKKPESTKQGLLGVIGTDLPIHFFNTFVAPPKLGVDAYAFASNHNGFILFHPDYVAPFDAPEFTNVDVSKIELQYRPWELYRKIRQVYNGPIRGFLENGTEVLVDVMKNDTAAAVKRVVTLLNQVNSSVPDYRLGLRRSMLRAKTGDFWMEALKAIEDNSRPKVIGMHHYFTPLPDTPFVFGVAIPGDRTDFDSYGFVRMNSRVSIRFADLTVFVVQEGLRTRIPSQWNYCELSAEELEVTNEDYVEHLEEMYHEFEENYNATSREEPPDTLELLDPSWPPEIYCEELEKLVNDTATYYINNTMYFNKTAMEIHNTTSFQVIDRFTYMTELNTTEESFVFNMARCIESVQSYHVDQLREDMQPWMFEKKFVQTIRHYIEKGKDGSVDFREKCDLEVIESLLFDAEITNDTIAKIFSGIHYHSNLLGINMVFIATHSGLTRYITPDHSECDFINTHPETIRESYYERAVEAGPDTIIFTIDTLPRYPRRLILAQSMFVEYPTTPDGKMGKTEVAVAGMEMPARVLYDLFFGPQCDDSGSRCPLQCSNMTICHLLDDNGYIVASSEWRETDSLTGRLMADVDPNLFIQLTNYDEVIEDAPPPPEGHQTIWKALYEMLFFDDYQAVCPVYEETSTAGLRLTNPITLAVRMSIFLLVRLFWLIGQVVTSTVTIIAVVTRNILSANAANNMPSECLAYLADGQATDDFWNCTVTQAASGRYEIKSEKPTRRVLGKHNCKKRYNVYRLNTKATRLYGEVISPNCHDCSTCSFVTNDGVCILCEGTKNGTKYRNLTSDEMPVCTRSWRTEIIPKTNLVALVADKWCVCKRDLEIAKVLENKTLEYATDEEQCRLLNMRRPRRRPEKCASENPLETNDICGSGSRIGSFSCNYYLVITLLATVLINDFSAIKLVHCFRPHSGHF